MARGWKRLATVAGGAAVLFSAVIGLVIALGDGLTLAGWLGFCFLVVGLALLIWGAVRVIGWVADGFFG